MPGVISEVEATSFLGINARVLVNLRGGIPTFCFHLVHLVYFNLIMLKPQCSQYVFVSIKQRIRR